MNGIIQWKNMISRKQENYYYVRSSLLWSLLLLAHSKQDYSVNQGDHSLSSST